MRQATDSGALSDPSIFFDLMVGPIRMAVLNTALELDITGLLDGGKPLEDVAEALGVTADTANLGYFLDAMSAMGFTEKQNGGYRNTPFAKAYLCRESPFYLGGMVKNLSRMQHRNLNRIPDLIRQGPPDVAPVDRLEGEAMWKQSVRHLACYQKAGMADYVADLVSALPEFPAMRRMLDMGCGPGIMCMTTVARHPSLRGVLCDLPTVMQVAREEIERAGMGSRITTIEGDYNEVDFGEGYDLVWASHTLYYAKDLGALLRRVCDALNPGGVFISFHEGMTRERTEPAPLVLSRLSLALEGQDVSFERGEIASRLPDAGFTFVETRILSLHLGPVEMVIGRKRG
jgi:SAM-dependent methyltransferase